MHPSLLFIISADPRQSGRPAEAIRIAVGVGVWGKVDIRLYFRGAAVLALGEFTDELVDEDHYTRYLPLVREWGRPVYVQRAAPLLADIGTPGVPFEPIEDADLARLAADSSHVLRF
jgi:hypothetical protein